MKRHGCGCRTVCSSVRGVSEFGSCFSRVSVSRVCGYNIVCYAIPDIVYLQVEKRIISAYNTWRMIFTTLGTICSSMLLGILTDYVDGSLLAAVGCAAVLFCCISYFRVFNN